LDKSPANWMGVKVMMPGRLDREPKLRAVEFEQFVTWIVQHK